MQVIAFKFLSRNLWFESQTYLLLEKNSSLLLLVLEIKASKSSYLNLSHYLAPITMNDGHQKLSNLKSKSSSMFMWKSGSRSTKFLSELAFKASRITELFSHSPSFGDRIV